MDGVEICLLKQTIQPFPVSVKFDGMTDINSLYGLHPQREMDVSDGDFVRKRPKRLHPTKEKAVSDGGSGQKCLNRPHPHRNKSLSLTEISLYPMETSGRSAQMGPIDAFHAVRGGVSSHKRSSVPLQEGQCPFTQGAAHVTQRRYYEILHSRDRWSGEGSGKREW